MAKKHTVSSGECIDSIAKDYGFFPASLWDHADNKDIRAKRENANTLCPGDVINIPDKRISPVSCASDARHSFRRKGVPSKLEINLYDAFGEPYANQQYILEVGLRRIEGVTNADGLVSEPIAPEVEEAVIRLPDVEMVFELDLGHLEPVETLPGVRQRLNNLGYETEADSGALTEEDQTAIRNFQIDQDLEASGELTEETRSKLSEVHGK